MNIQLIDRIFCWLFLHLFIVVNVDYFGKWPKGADPGLELYCPHKFSPSLSILRPMPGRVETNVGWT